ncbi:MAG TPA: hypothetical protein VKR22_00090 [Acidimicrobiales bacterium]|nr:hypothetical protein [Acidimicrobiales bacterium]
MIVADLLLAANLVFFVVLAFRAPRAPRAGLDTLMDVGLRPARTPAPAPVPLEAVGNVVPFRTRADLHLAHARSLHPSSHPFLNPTGRERATRR